MTIRIKKFGTYFTNYECLFGIIHAVLFFLLMTYKIIINKKN